MQKFHFNVRDVFSGPRVALGLQRTWISFLGLSIAYAFYLIFTYFALMASRIPFTEIWQRFGILPCTFVADISLPWFAKIIAGAGLLMFFYIISLTQTAISRAAFMNAKGNPFFTWQEAFVFARGKIWQVILTPLAILVLTAFLFAGFFIIANLGKIPLIGEIGVALFSIIWFIGALFIIFFILVAIIAAILAPAILASTEDDAFEAIFQSFSIVWAKPLLFIFSVTLTIILAIMAGGGMSVVFFNAFLLMDKIFITFMGPIFTEFSNQAFAVLAACVHPLAEFFGNILPSLSFCADYPTMAISASNLGLSGNISAILYTLLALFIGGWILAYTFASFSSSITFTFIFLKFKKDDDNLLDTANLLADSDDYLQENDTALV